MRVGIVSGYFNPIHGGHIDMIREAAEKYDEVLVIINNDKQQILKKGKIIMEQEEREKVVRALRYVDTTVIAIDDDSTVCQTLEVLAKHGKAKLYFCNGGDRNAAEDVPEAKTCKEHGITMMYGVGGAQKSNSSSNINKLRGKE